jgi:ERCC4-type nuclease
VADQQISVLTALPGIGPVTARALLARFGSVEQMLHASLEELTMITGISPARAAILIEILRAPYASLPGSAALP